MARSHKRINIDFPVKSHVYKYLKYTAGEKLIVSKKMFIGSVILDILSKSGRYTLKSPTDIIYPVEISIDYMNRYGVIVSDVTKNKFNKYVDQLFRLELLAYIRICKKSKSKTVYAAIRDFLKLYDITEDEIKFDTLLKFVHRNLN